MTAFECRGRDPRRRRRPRVPARRAPRRRPRAARLLVAARPARPDRRASCSRTGTRTTSARCPYLLREVGAPEIWATRLTLGLVQVEARRARAPPRGRAARDRPRTRRPSGSARSRLEFVRMAHSIPDAVAVVLDTPGGPHRRHRRLQDRPHAGRRPAHRRRQARRDRQPRRRPPARRLDERRAARRTRGPSASSARRSARSSRSAAGASSSPRSPRTSTACSRPSTSPSECGRKVCVVGRSMRKNLNIARNLGYVDVPDGIADQAGRPGRVPPATRC